MFDLERQTAYWLTGSDEDWRVGCGLVERGEYRHGLFFIHLSLEKMLKALVCRRTQRHPPKIHDLLRLGQRTCLELTEDQLRLFALVNTYCLEGRYPTSWGRPPGRDEAERVIARVQEIREWLRQRL